MVFMRSENTRSFTIALGAFFLSASFCQAQHMNAVGAPCREPASGAETTQCFSHAYASADKELNLVYGRIHGKLAPTEVNQLQAAQRLWIQYRDANCSAERDIYLGESAMYMVYKACLEADTRQRIKELNTTYDWVPSRHR
jgi:uncharacterized protein YecT (DUF1311 family)